MDLISSLASTLGIPADQASALAGLALGTAKSQVAEKDGALAGTLAQKVPELASWEAAASKAQATLAAPSGGGLLGGLMSAAGSGLGNQLLGAVAGQNAAQGAALIGLLGKLGLSADHARLAAPVLLKFLESRLGPDTVQKVLGYAPLLASASSFLGK